MRVAIDETNRIFEEVGGFARIGVSEREIYDFVQQRIDERGLGYAWDRAGDPIVNTGPDSMIGHGRPSPAIRVAPGHILHLDLGVVREAYGSDIQRCWYVPREGERGIPDDVRRALGAVNGAITAGAGALRPGVEGWTVDAAGRRQIVAAGYPEYQHSLGHQVGRLAHDGGALLGPRWERYGRTPFLKVEPDQVFTLELGVIVEGRGYLGIEEMVQVTEDGCAWLTERQLGMPMLPATARAAGA
jgi:Xaa-Pro aminopeptidase